MPDERERGDKRSGLSKRQFTIRETVNICSSECLQTLLDVYSLQQTCWGWLSHAKDLKIRY